MKLCVPNFLRSYTMTFVTVVWNILDCLIRRNYPLVLFALLTWKVGRSSSCWQLMTTTVPATLLTSSTLVTVPTGSPLPGMSYASKRSWFLGTFSTSQWMSTTLVRAPCTLMCSTLGKNPVQGVSYEYLTTTSLIALYYVNVKLNFMFVLLLLVFHVCLCVARIITNGISGIITDGFFVWLCYCGRRGI